MEIMAETFRSAGMVAGTSLEGDGDPTLAILKKAREVRADLIIMGSHGKGVVKQFLLGSVSHKVLSHWPGSILIERLPFEERRSGGLEKVCQRRVSRVILAGRAPRLDAPGCTLLWDGTLVAGEPSRHVPQGPANRFNGGDVGEAPGLIPISPSRDAPV
jgi:hypothetical protein